MDFVYTLIVLSSNTTLSDRNKCFSRRPCTVMTYETAVWSSAVEGSVVKGLRGRCKVKEEMEKVIVRRRSTDTLIPQTQGHKGY